jgi:hypothetical protein
VKAFAIFSLGQFDENKIRLDVTRYVRFRDSSDPSLLVVSNDVVSVVDIFASRDRVETLLAVDVYSFATRNVPMKVTIDGSTPVKVMDLVSYMPGSITAITNSSVPRHRLDPLHHSALLNLFDNIIMSFSLDRRNLTGEGDLGNLVSYAVFEAGQPMEVTPMMGLTLSPTSNAVGFSISRDASMAFVKGLRQVEYSGYIDVSWIVCGRELFHSAATVEISPTEIKTLTSTFSSVLDANLVPRLVITVDSTDALSLATPPVPTTCNLTGVTVMYTSGRSSFISPTDDQILIQVKNGPLELDASRKLLYANRTKGLGVSRVCVYMKNLPEVTPSCHQIYVVATKHVHVTGVSWPQPVDIALEKDTLRPFIQSQASLDKR